MTTEITLALGATHTEFKKAIKDRDNALTMIDDALVKGYDDEYILKWCLSYHQRQTIVGTWYRAIRAMTQDEDLAWSWEHDINGDNAHDRLQDIYAKGIGYDLMLRAKMVHRGVESIPVR